MLTLLSLLVATDEPVIRLEDALLEGTHKRPAIIELEAKNLDQKVQEAALKNLIQLESDLLTPSPAPKLQN